MTSIAEIKKKHLHIGKGKKQLITIDDLFGGKEGTDAKFRAVLQKSVENVLDDLLREIAGNILTNENVLNHVADLVMTRLDVPEEPEAGLDGLPGDTPVKGEDYFTEAEILEFTERIQAGIRIPEDGKPGKPGAKGEPGKKPLKGVDYFTQKDQETIVEDVKQRIDPVTGEEMVKEINKLEIKPNLQIDAKHIKGLPDRRDGTDLGGIHRGGLKLVWQTQLDGTVNGANTVFTVPAGQPDPKDDKFIISVRGVLKTSDAGDFTASNSNRTITFATAPPSGSDAPRIILYHGR